MMNELNVCLSHIKKGYSRPVLEDINLTISNESFISIVGESGSGKSTLLNIIGLIESFDKGDFTFNGIAIKGNHGYSKLRRDNIGFIFQNYNLIPTLTCRENILLPTLYNNRPVIDRLDELVDLLDISHLLSQRVNVLSGGEKQRVAFARSLILDPCLLLADEPTGNLDPKNRDIVLNLLQKENQVGRGVILITHDMNVAELGKTILCLNAGKLYEE